MSDIVPRRSIMPAIVDDAGNPLEGPEMEKVSGLVMQMAQLAQLPAYVTMRCAFVSELLQATYY